MKSNSPATKAAANVPKVSILAGCAMLRIAASHCLKKMVKKVINGRGLLPGTRRLYIFGTVFFKKIIVS